MQIITDSRRPTTLSWILVAVAVVGIMSAGGYFFMRSGDKSPPATSIIRMAVLPDEDQAALRARFTPLRDYLSQTTGLEFHLVFPEDYAHLRSLFTSREADLCYFGGLTFVQVFRSDQAMPLVMREIDTRFTTYFLVNGKSAATKLSQLKNGSLSFGSQLSTSGHLMPRLFFERDHGIVPENFFNEIRYSGGHDSTAYLVRDGQVDLGVANSEIIDDMLADGRLEKSDLRILMESPPYPDYVWAVQREMDALLQNTLRDAFLELNPSRADHRTVLDSLGALYFLPARSADFEPLIDSARKLGLLDEEVGQ